MSGTSEGAKKAAQANKERHGEDFYQRIGKLSTAGWEKNGRKPKGFATMSAERLKEVSAKGGTISRLGKKEA